MKRVIVFTYYWPPAGGIAVQRFLKFSRYLPDNGWQPLIVTVKDGSYPNYDESLLADVPEGLPVYRTNTFEPFELYNLLRGKRGKSLPTVSVTGNGGKSVFQRVSEYIRANFFIPDARVGWVKYAVKQAEQLIEAGGVDAIVTTGPPHSTHLIGLQLKKKYGIKWLADFRDPWTEIFYNRFLPRTAASAAKDKAYEDEVLKAADCVTVISGGMKDKFAGRAARVEVVYNGYDDRKFAEPAMGEVVEDGFLFTYTGNLLASQNVPALWQAFAELQDVCPEMKILIIGRADEQVKQAIAQAGIEPMVQYKDFMPHSRVVNYMWHSHMLLFLLANVPESKLLMTGKVFEYLPTGTELMGIGPVDGSAQQVMQQAGREPMIDYADKETMKARLLSAYTYWKQHGKARKNTGIEHRRFAVSNITTQLAGLLNSL